MRIFAIADLCDSGPESCVIPLVKHNYKQIWDRRMCYKSATQHRSITSSYGTAFFLAMLLTYSVMQNADAVMMSCDKMTNASVELSAK